MSGGSGESEGRTGEVVVEMGVDGLVGGWMEGWVDGQLQDWVQEQGAGIVVRWTAWRRSAMRRALSGQWRGYEGISESVVSAKVRQRC